jgi:hypothetical protein
MKSQNVTSGTNSKEREQLLVDHELVSATIDERGNTAKNGGSAEKVLVQDAKGVAGSADGGQFDFQFNSQMNAEDKNFQMTNKSDLNVFK